MTCGTISVALFGRVFDLGVDLEQRLRHGNERLARPRIQPQAADVLEETERAEPQVEGGEAADDVSQAMPVEIVEPARMDERRQQRGVRRHPLLAARRVGPAAVADHRVGRANGNDERGRARRRPLVAVHPQLAFEVQLGDVECDRAARARDECQSLRLEREVVDPVDRDLLRLVDLEAGDGPDPQGGLVLARRLDVLREEPPLDALAAQGDRDRDDVAFLLDLPDVEPGVVDVSVQPVERLRVGRRRTEPSGSLLLPASGRALVRPAEQREGRLARGS